MKLRFLARWLAVAALFLSAASAHAYVFSFDGIYYNVLSEEDRTVEVSRCRNFVGLFTCYQGDVAIPERAISNGITYTVISIAKDAFQNCGALKSVDMSSTFLTSIEDETFFGCSSLTSVDLSSTSLTSIGDEAFSGCDALTSVAFPASLTSIGKYAFENCDALTSVDLSSTSLTSIGGGAFMECGALTSVSFPASLTSIGSFAFYNCGALTSVDFSSTSLTSIGEYAFSDCDALTSVSFPASLTSIGNRAFDDCYALTSVDLSSTSLTSIGEYAFRDCDALTSVAFPASLMSIGDDAFWDCGALTSVDLSSTSLTSIGGAAFRDCDALTSVALPVSLTSIGNRAFRDCSALTNLTVDEGNPAFTSRDNVLYSKNLDTLVCYPTGANKEVVIPETVRSVREDAFPGKVNTVYCQPQTPPTAVDGEFQDMFTDETLMNAVLYVPVGTKTAYMQVDPWRNFWNIEESDFATVGIDGVTAEAAPSVTVCGGKIVVDGASTTGVIEVFSTDGRCAYRGTSTVIEGLPKGAYVVRIGKFTQKVML
ncbi:MAG TPA: leucine-rich repeat protein [Candidatus Caccomonas pullistercoris]|nr:leucine-rich repeat protein [Candidatus Caccomonas pullistercoris]